MWQDSLWLHGQTRWLAVNLHTRAIISLSNVVLWEDVDLSPDVFFSPEKKTSGFLVARFLRGLAASTVHCVRKKRPKFFFVLSVIKVGRC